MSFLQQALLVVATAIVVAFFIPAFYKPSYPVPEVFGTVAPGFEEVKVVFRENYEDNWDNREAGSAFSVYYKGENVVDLWAGFADMEAKRLWKEDTMTVIFSTTKGLTALCAAMLADRGLIDFKKPVAHYWPEFAQHGKEKITVEQLLEHEAGLLATDSPLSYEILTNYTALDKILAETKPKWEPGTRHGYHGITFGPYVDAIVRRVDPEKRSIGKFFDEEVSKPFDIDAYIGAPLELDHRTGRCTNVQERFSDIIYGLRNVEVIRTLILGRIFGGNESGKLNKLMFETCGNICEAGNIFGASGLGGQVGYADPNFHIGYGFVSRYMSPMGIQMYDPRFKRLKDSMMRAIKNLQERP
ncbi:Beta-lactamase domain-containing protein 2 [Holothuria leucospilota]|uniref:Beta-lactamase domain-containing protein 2 n=1 Tax=Holothuria leucospilota TaxID=206669 RepID=A0A9Q1HL75_HOLLE|nr:Beta-lactamase domain-containing protein 2 [Holothuria leucospilota]